MTHTAARRQAAALIQRLPATKLKVALDFLTYLRTKEEWDATIEILESPALLRSLRRGQRDLRQGRWVRWSNVKRRV